MTAHPDRPNILWFCTDQQRWDTIGALGNPHVRTPNLDALCASGTAFNRAYTQSPICTPARASMLTGRYPASHHVYRNGNAYWPAHERLVTRLFADAGYDCGLIGKLHLSAAKRYEVRPDDGYRVFLWNHHPTPDAARGDAYEHWLRHEKKVDPQALYRDKGAFCGPGVPAEYHQTTWCAEMAVRFVTDRRDCPFLLSVNPFDPHAPFDAAPEYLAEFDPDALPLPLWRDSDAERWLDFEQIDQQQKRPQDPRIRRPPLPPASRDHDTVASHVPEGYDALAIKANYYAMIRHLDDALGRIMEALKATGQLDNTIILFHSDHGEMLGDHGLVLKGCRFFEGLVRVPMIWSLPGRFRKGLVSEALVELVDIAPTLLEACGLPVPETIQGRSLLPILEGQTDPHVHKNYVVSEFKDAISTTTGGGNHSHGSMVFDGRWKSIVYHGHSLGEIFDIKNDPGEFDNLWGDVGLRAERLKLHLDALAATVFAGPPRIEAY